MAMTIKGNLVNDAVWPPWLVEGDYQQAVLHLAWDTVPRRRRLVFGLLELIPTDVPLPDEIPELQQPYRDKDGVQHRLFVRKTRVSLATALTWYLQCRRSVVTLPDDPEKDGSPKVLVTSARTEDPPWPHLAACRDLPFVAAGWGTVRAHHILQEEALPAIAALLQRPPLVTWLRDHLLFDLTEYPEWVGSIHLVAPNPLCRALESRAEIARDGTVRSVIHLVPRSGHRLDGLRLRLVQAGPTGVTALKDVVVTDPVTCLPHVGAVEKVGYWLVCPIRGVLDWSPPLAEHGVLAAVPEQPLGTAVPVEGIATREGQAAPMSQPTPSAGVIQADPYTPMHRVELAQQARRFRQGNAASVERWFGEHASAAAREFVRELVGSARSRVWIVDSYFSPGAFYRFAFSSVHAGVEITILAGEQLAKRHDAASWTTGPDVALRQWIDALDRQLDVRVLIMTGKKPVVHDRFLVIDDAVWLAGASLHNLGERAGMIVQLAGSAGVIGELASILAGKRIRPLTRPAAL